MTTESCYAIATATLRDWLKKSSATFSTNQKQNQEQLHLQTWLDVIVVQDWKRKSLEKLRFIDPTLRHV